MPQSRMKSDQLIRKSEGFTNPLCKRLYTIKEGAGYLGRSEWGMRELIWAGEIAVVRTDGGRKIFLDIQELNDFIDRHKSVYK